MHSTKTSLSSHRLDRLRPQVLVIRALAQDVAAARRRFPSPENRPALLLVTRSGEPAPRVAGFRSAVVGPPHNEADIERAFAALLAEPEPGAGFAAEVDQGARLNELESRIEALEKERSQLSGVLEKMNLITQISHEISSLDFADIVNVCIFKVPQVLKARYASLYLYNYQESALVLKRHNHPAEIEKVIKLSSSSPSLMREAILRRWPLVIQDVNEYAARNHLEMNRRYADKYASRSCVIAPLVVGDRIVGVLNLSDKTDGGAFSEIEDLAPITQIASLAGAAIRNYQLYNEVVNQARLDSMTQLLNHRTFFEELQRAIQEVKRYKEPLSLIAVDVDKLKAVNDKAGHQAGDLVLKTIASTIRDGVRDVDAPARYGGDEFMVILSRTDLDRAVTVAERLRASVAEELSRRAPELPRVTLSMGVGEYAEPDTASAFIRKVDMALYCAKNEGRDRVVAIRTPPPSCDAAAKTEGKKTEKPGS